MKKIGAEDLKANFSEVLKTSSATVKTSGFSGMKRKIDPKMILKTVDKLPKRKLDILEGQEKVNFAREFKVTQTASLRA